jgi:hypothetical protein
MPRRVPPYPGERAIVRPVFGGYRLPDGLADGDEVTLIDFRPGYWTVEKEGKRYDVFMGGIEPLRLRRPAL